MQHDATDAPDRGATDGGTTDADGGVGRGRPPRHSRFKPGQSGNPRGREKGSRNLATLLEAELRRPVTLTEGGRRRRMPKAAAMVAGQVNKALRGDTRAFSILLQATNRRQHQAAGGHGEAADGMDSDGMAPGGMEGAAIRALLVERIGRMVRGHDAERDSLIAELAAAGIAETHLDHLFGPRGERLRDGMMAALQAVHARGFDIREVADLAVFSEAAEECAAALLGEAPTGHDGG